MRTLGFLLALSFPYAASAQVIGIGGFGGQQGGFGGVLGAGGIGGIGGQGGQGGAGGMAGMAGMAGMGGGGGGILIDPKGVVTPQFTKDPTGRLTKKRREAVAKKFLPQDLNKPSKLRKISLVRLEKELEKYVKAGKNVPLELQFLAGLQRIDYIFLYPPKDGKPGDIVIAGPAEGFSPDDTNRVVGLTTRRPPIRLDDLLHALRAVWKSNKIGCSIDPKTKNLAALQNYVRLNSRPAPAAVARARYPVMARILGLQDVSVWGVPSDSVFSSKLVEADIRMKLITLGRYRPKVKGFKSHLAMLRPGANSMQRWWFVPLYDAIKKSPQGDAFSLEGQRAQLMAQNELVDANGRRTPSAFTKASTTGFAKHFTQKFPQLAQAVPAFADLQNLIDLSILAALMEKENLAAKAGWKAVLFRDEKRVKTFTRKVPKEVPSTFGAKMSSRAVLGLIGGGVEINPRAVLAKTEYTTDPRVLPSAHKEAAAPEKSTRWWWD